MNLNKCMNIESHLKELHEMQVETNALCKTILRTLKKKEKNNIDQYKVCCDHKDAEINLRVSRQFCKSLFREVSDRQFTVS